MNVNTILKCPKCLSDMEEGFVLDSVTHAESSPSQWVAGAPEKSFLFGTNTTGRERYVVRSFRCKACGFLEAYAAR